MIELLKNRSVISVTGADALKFLQGMTTNDLENHQNSYNYLLSPQGKYLHDFFVSKVSDAELLIDIDYSCAGAFIQKLNLYKLRRAVQLEDLSDDYCVVYSKSSFQTTRHPEEVGLAPTWGSHEMSPTAPLNDGYITSYQDPRFHKLGFRSIIKASYVNSLELISNDVCSNSCCHSRESGNPCFCVVKTIKNCIFLDPPVKPEDDSGNCHTININFK